MKEYPMKRILFIIGLLVCNTIFIHAQADEESRIRKAALDYADGFYSGDYERIGNVLHPDLNKVYLQNLPQTNSSFPAFSTISGLIEYTRSNIGFVAPDERNIEIYVLSISDDVAVVKLMSAQFNDFLHLVKMNDKWQILNVLWSSPLQETQNPQQIELDKEIEEPLIEAAIRRYYEGQFSTKTEVIEDVVHPEISIAQLSKIELNGRSSIRRSGKSQLVELSRIGYFRKQESDRTVDIQEIYIMDRMSSVKSNTSFETSYFQLQKIDGNWIIINVLKK